MDRHVALYRKYRPSGFDNLIGQKGIKKALINSLKNKNVSHAYLFSGPRGTGKTSAALLMAKSLSCSTEGVDPCGKCNGCKTSNPDIVEMDAASNNGVDEIRDIRDKIQYSPVYGAYKIYIIDEVHMLSTSAFNALLKTLEEPPKHVVFILATTEPHKVPATIISRCQRYDFRRISQVDMINHMNKILKIENQNVETEALRLIAQLSSGGMRDALSLLDQCISLSDNGTVTLDDVIALTGAVDIKNVGKMVHLIESLETEKALAHLEVCIEYGNTETLMEEIMNYYRDILIFLKTGCKENIKSIADSNFFSFKLDQNRILSNIEIIGETLEKLKFQKDSNIIAEVAIIKMTNPKDNLQEEVKRLQEEVKLLKHYIQNEKSPVNEGDDNTHNGTKKPLEEIDFPLDSIEETEDNDFEIEKEVEELLKESNKEEAETVDKIQKIEQDEESLTLDQAYCHLKRAKKKYKLEYINSSSEIMSELKKLKISTMTLFKNFTVRAVTKDTLLVSHPERISVKLLNKPTNREIILQALGVYKHLDLLVLTDEEWNSILQRYKEEMK